MELQSLTPPPGNHKNTGMALTLTSAPNSYGAMKFSASESQYKSERLEKPPENSLSNSASSSVKNNGPDSSVDSDESDDSSSSDDRVKPGSSRLDELSDDNEPVDCDDCNKDFPSMQAYMEHNCARKSSDHVTSETFPAPIDGDLSEGESFDGKIVYNSDGSAYIIEGGDSDLSDLDSIIDLPNQENIIVDKKGSDIASQVPAFPHIANAFFVSKNFKNMYSIPSSPCPAPIMFSYRVYDVRSEKSDSDIEVEQNSTSDESLVPTKPILMCFICKLSFGYAKSFMAHASSEHSMSLNDREKDIMSKKNASAIIQCVGKEKEPLMSFLEPKPLSSSPKMRSLSSASQLFSPSSIKQSSYGSIGDNTSVSFVYSKPKLSSPPFLQLNSGKSSSENSQGHLAKKELDSQHNDIRSSTNGYDDDENDNLADDDVSSLEISGIRKMDSSQESSFLQKLKQNSESFTKSMVTSNHSPLFPPSTISMANTSHSMMFLGVCDEHPQGRVQGVECPKCDMVLGSSQSLGGHMTMMHSRNSCKTLKCPKCNWHYKYQETLEIHMKEKHPDNDQQCLYCISSQPHPRLARGESYSCGYKPYRCEVCNYSTTTKGNLSIHMQSDKHLNNVQELANGNAEVKIPQQLPAQPPQPPLAVDPLSHLKKNKPKPTWRCDVCNYETNVARNLRIHMTSEKHTHNMMVLQQNMKHMQRDMQIQQMNQLMLLQNDPAFLAGISSPGVPGNVNFQFDQSMMIPVLQGQFGEIPVDMRKENGGMGMSFDPHTPDASRMFQCCVCNQHATDSLENLHQHLQHDRTKHREQENIHVSQGTYICNLCQYKTQLKANFQLHCKTDKHLQRLQLVNHIKEGGSSNEWRLKYLNVSNPVQVRCNACDYYTNSIHKLQIHTGNPRHESNSQLFRHLQHGESKLNPSIKKYYHCTLCSFSSRAKQNLIQHVRSMKHMHNEGLKQIQMKEQNITEIDPGEIFMVKEYKEEEEESIKFDEEDGESELDDGSMVTETELPDKHSDLPAGMFTPNTLPSIAKGGSLNNNNNTGSSNSNVNNEEQIHVCPYCDYSSVSEIRIQGHILTQHTHRSHQVLCPLCQEEFKDKARLERHLMSTHSVKAEGLHRLLMMVDKGDWMPSPVTNAPANQNAVVPTPNIPNDESGEINLEVMEAEASKLEVEEAIDTANFTEKGEIDNQYRCQTCSKTFSNIDGLYAHQNELGHLELKQTPRGPGYLCWKKGCNQYFKTAQALQVHFREIHAKCQILSASDRHIYKYKCTQCSLAFKNSEKLEIHNHYHLIRTATKCNYCGQSFSSIATLRKHVELGHTEVEESDKRKYFETMSENAEALAKILAISGMEKLLTNVSSKHENGNSSAPLDAEKSSLVGSDSTESASDAAKTDLNSNETMDKLDRGETSSPTESEKKLEDMDTSDGGEYKDQQFLEDYMNSQAIAEGGYEDPNRKFKCHRCKVAFTKQNYLTAHNKTLLHRKGDKMSYPMEKYLDPNRPFKCDVCKESFTQKNILVVHYNSVSHLHKVKQALQQGEGPLSPPNMDSIPATTASTTSSETPSQSSADDKNKTYKCNICKVSYSQGSTLDIHIRSVGHQTTAAKLPELIMSGQIDLSQPLIEQPSDVPKSQQQKLLAEMLQPHQILAATTAVSQPSLLFPGITSGIPPVTGLTQFNMLPGLSLPTSVTELTKSLPSPSYSSSKFKENRDGEEAMEFKQETTKSDGVEESKFLKTTYSCNRCNAVFINQENLSQHQIACLYQSGGLGPQSRSRNLNFLGRKTQVQKNLLENIGFECVMQFNEFNQPLIKREAIDEEDEDEEGDGENKVEPEREEKKEADKPERVENNDLPELNKSVCVTCRKEFSSVWVLKSHQEEVHKEVVPIDLVENLGEQFKTDFEKKQPKETEKVPSPAPSDSVSISASDTPTPTMESNSEMPPPPPPSSAPQISPAQLDMAAQMMPMFGLGMHMPIPLSMAMAMNLQPPLMPMMFGPLVGDGSLPNTPTSMAEQSLPKQQQAAQTAQLAAQQAALNQKRARTRINDEQLKILRAHFDINNSPSEEQINAMSEQSGLPQKVIKHWFRNTLFKERQRNKDSPYNFNNPPLTTLDLEEYEKTGKIPQVSEEKSQDIKPVLVKEPEIQVKKESTKVETSSVTQLSQQQQQQQDFQKQMQQYQQQQQQHLQQLKQQLQQQQQNMLKEKVIDPSPLKHENPHRESPELSDNDYSNMSASSSIPSTPNHMASFMMSSGSGDDIRPRFEPTPYHSGYAKRANRTRFTDYQIKVLQEYFEQNAYPKDDELDHLSQILNLSPRVIVVWFQNARQKARKIYENQPPPESKESPTVNANSPFQRTPGLNYQCKKCSAVFQRYYDLIRHQKKQCGLDSEKIPMPLHGGMEDDSDSLSTLSRDDFNDETASTNSHDVSNSGDKDHVNKIKFKCENCHLSFDGLEHWQEHQAVHAMNPGLFGNLPSNSAFGVLQSMAAAQQQENKNLMKRKLNDSFDDKFDDDDDQPRDKRLRTTILPEQLDYLYQKYQVDCNPSRKQLETISADVGLKKRVVQVWFQNTRARERKGQYRAHQQLIHKRCPFCRALFRAKSALESHLATKHPEEMAKGDINVDNLPDAAIEPPGSHGFGSLMTSPSDMSKLLSPQGMQSFMPGLSFSDQLQISMKQFYEDSYKKYMSDLTSTPKDHPEKEKEYDTPHISKSSSTSTKTSNGGSEAPLDLSKPLKVNTDHDKHSEGPSTDISERSFEEHNISNKSFNDSISETCSNNENDDCHSITTSRPSSPLGHSSLQGKRYRTQMTSLQVRIMKSIFVDYKTPTMAECEMLGREIGLPKRVVQVWFQNARAKEKKAKLTMGKGYSAELDFPKPPEECSLCHFKYSHKYTIQDHIFTKKHIEKVKLYIQSQSDVESNLTGQGASSSTSDSLHQHQEMGRMRKAWDEAAAIASSESQIAQIQAMRLGALGLPQMPGFNPADILKDLKKEKKERDTESDSKSQGSNKENDVAAQIAAANMMNPFGAGFLPGMDPSMFPYMGFPGMPGFMPGMGMPFMPPGFMPGAEHLLQYDPMTFGTPLSLLQIPPQAIKDVSIKLSEPKANVAQYTQDCKSINSLKSLVNSVDYSCARESTVDVGYICKKCQTVYPAKDACLAHQKTLCYPTVPENIQPLLKLEQIQYECCLCTDKWSTVQEYKQHCQGESHKAKTARLHHKISPSKSSATSHSAVQGTTQPKDSSHTPTKSLSSSIIPSPLPKNDLKGDQNEASD